MAVIDQVIEQLQPSVRGSVIGPDDAEYDEARRVWNVMIDKRPAAIVRCSGPADVVAAVNFAREHGLLTAVRGGGHSAAGKGTCDDGLVIDLSPMKGIRVDPDARTVRAQGGVTWGDFDHETQAYGLATTGGVISTTGIAGLTLGGGFGWLTRRFGLSCDNLLSVDLVTAAGEQIVLQRGLEPRRVLGAAWRWRQLRRGHQLRVPAPSRRPDHPGRAHRLAARAGSRRVGLPSGADAQCARRARHLVGVRHRAAAAVRARVVALQAGGRGDLLLVGRRRRRPGSRSPLARPRTSDPDGRGDAVHRDELDPGRARAYRGATATGSPAISPSTRTTRSRPRPTWRVGCRRRSAWPRSCCGAVRSAEWAPTILRSANETRGSCSTRSRCSRTRTQRKRTWRGAREFYDAMQPYATDGVYVNFLSEEGDERVVAAYGPEKFARLARIKRDLDPDNLFRLTRTSRPRPDRARRGSCSTTAVPGAGPRGSAAVRSDSRRGP